MSGRLVILSGPSGVGKDTVIDRWRAINPKIQRVVAYTTRQPREGEIPDVDYHFVSVPRFHELASKGAFLEHKEVHGNFYATPLHDMEAMLSDGKIAVLKIDVQGAISATKLRPDALSIFILPPSMEELERRIRDRGTEDEPSIQRRLKNARDEIELSNRYQVRVENRDLEDCVRQLEAVVAR